MNSEKQLIAVKAIQKKLLGKKLTHREIFILMDEIAHHRMSDVLTAYFVASSFKEGYSPSELYEFTQAMVETGNTFKFKGIVADKHSTGGVAGTRTTMILVPIIAAAGIKIPKISSRAITTPAGTADTMEVLAKVNLTPKEIKRNIEKVGGCIAWNEYLNIAPADDIIIKVEEPLSFESFDKVIISVMAKKIAVGTNHLIIDLPVGKTMKIRHFRDAEKVRKKFSDLAKKFKIKIVFDISETLEPAGRGVGPALEARDVLYVLEQKPERPLKLEAKALRLAGKLLDLCFSDMNVKKSGEDEARRLLADGSAIKKFREIIKAQHGDSQVTSENFKLKSHILEIKSPQSGKIKEVNNFNLNSLAKILGAPHDKYAGIYLYRRLDELIGKKEPLMQFHSTDKYKLKEAEISYRNFPVYDIE